MLDHLLFNKLKWFNISDNQKAVTAGTNTYVNIKSIFPVDAVLNKDTWAFTVESSGSNIKVPAGTHITIKGMTFSLNGALEGVSIVPYEDGWNELYDLDWSNLNINWGGKHPLTHFWRAFKSLLITKEVA
ncbi:hypothetical protein LA2_05880 [Lactobacillus amylovorus GRL 1112]|uniref:Uncharacterized protein n=1 Tax=Lactobacillus amylovorus (strain GRL 1112) TaxID=695560 RepID=E4SIY6_LACAR|nr:hypothetical protein [Lactobacillus amylovorus]ADQ59135.1 hypothetical protein LA2_05880 [Lactobacillus amylovorus GRL 1112]